MGRTFKCTSCERSWETDLPGRFTLCPSCREAKSSAKRAKLCGYRHCGQPFTDDSPKNSRKFCCSEHGRREKLFRSGLAQDESYFRANRPKLNPLCMACGERWPRVEGDRAVRCPRCRSSAREKVCTFCSEPFYDDTPKNTRKAHPSCARSALRVKPDRQAVASKRLEARRRGFLRSGTHGRLDDIASLKKGSHTWWGRVSELIFKEYRPVAEDANVSFGAQSPFDFLDPDLGKVDVRGVKARVSPEGRPMWAFSVDGLRESCDTAFLVGYRSDRSGIDFIWQIPSAKLPERSLRMAPGSSEYAWEGYCLNWDTSNADRVLTECLSLPDPVRPKDRFSWLDDPAHLIDKAPGHRGRRGELLYQSLYPEAVDQNRAEGSTASFDFLHPDGTRVNVKTSRFILRSDRSVYRWSFSRGFLKEHNCDVYSCLCLDHVGRLVREYRIPSSVWGDRRVIHIYDNEQGQWQPYSVPLRKEGLAVPAGKWSHTCKKDITLDKATEMIRPLTEEALDDVVRILLRTPFPRRGYGPERLLGDFSALVRSRAVRVEGDAVVGQSHAGLALCDAFFEHRYEATYKKSISVKSAWEDPSWLEKAVKFQINVGDPLLPWNVFRALRALLRTPSNFRPTVARAVVEAFSDEGDLVLDPCAGYGGRAAGTLAAGRRYIGVDPHPQAGQSFERMVDLLGFADKVSFHNIPFEDTDFPENSADLAFTSPPYFSVERYADHPDQSWVKHPSWESWRDVFLRVLIQKVFHALKPGAAFCFNVADAKFGKVTYPIVGESIRLALETGFSHERTLSMPLGRFGKKSKSEPILVFRKP